MTTSDLSPGRATAIEGTDGLTFVIPMPRQIVSIAITAIISIAMLGAGIAAMIAISRGADIGADSLVLVQTLGWLLGGSILLLVTLWGIAGRERITFGAKTVTVDYQLFGMRRRRVYNLAGVTGIRAAAMPLDRFGDRNRSLQAIGIGGGVIAFDYDGKLVRCGSTITLSEGEMIVARARDLYRETPGPTARKN